MEHVVRSPGVRHLDLSRRRCRRPGGRGDPWPWSRRGSRVGGVTETVDEIDLDRSAPTWPSCSPGVRCSLTPGGPRWWPGDTSGVAVRPARTSTTCATRVSFTEYGGFAIAAQRRRRRSARSSSSGRRPTGWWGAPPGSTATSSTTSGPGVPSSPTTTRSWPVPRASRTTGRRTACSSWSSACGCRWCCSPRAEAAGRATPTTPSSPASTPRRSPCSAA